MSVPMLNAVAEDRTIDFSGNNTDKTKVTYSEYISLPSSDVVNVKMARYSYFTSKIEGSGTLNLYGGGERCYLGTNKVWPDWSRFTGDVHVLSYREKTSSAGFYGIVLSHGNKSFSPENIEDDIKSGKVNTSLANNKMFLHKGATLANDANSYGAGFRIGELNTEDSSFVQGYIKKNTRPSYYIIGGMNTTSHCTAKLHCNPSCRYHQGRNR
jgi:hypothetical protein